MQKLTSTWRNQKASLSRFADPKNNEGVQKTGYTNQGKRRLGRLPITSSSVIVKKGELPPVPVALPLSTQSDSKDGDIPASFRSSFSASVDSDLIKELERVEAALHVDSDTNTNHGSNSEAFLTDRSRSKPLKQDSKENAGKPSHLNDVSVGKGNKSVCKRKHVKTNKSQISNEQEKVTNANCHAALRSSLISNAVFSPTNSPLDKKPKPSMSQKKNSAYRYIKGKDGGVNNMPLENSAVTLTARQSSDLVLTPARVDTSSLECSEISFSPLCSPLDSVAGSCGREENGGSNKKPSVCRELHLKTAEKHAINENKTMHVHSGNTVCTKVSKPQTSPNTTNKRPIPTHLRVSQVSAVKKGKKKEKERNAVPSSRLELTAVVCVENNEPSEVESSILRSETPQDTNEKHKKQKSVNVESSKFKVISTESIDTATSGNVTFTQRKEVKAQGPIESPPLSVRPTAKSESPQVSASLPADKRQLSSWGLPEPVLEAYKKQGVQTMFEWQAECLLVDNVLDGGNLVYSAPTSAGKTLVAELLILKRVVETRKKALFILPFVSVAREKMYSLQALYQDAGIRVGGYMGSYSSPGGLSHIDVAVCTIEKGNGIINRLMEEGKIENLGAVVIDELHMVGDSHRGYLLELMLTKLAYITQRAKDGSTESQVQIIGMSATLPNLSLLAKWLKASLYHTDFRPVPLTEHIKVDTQILDTQLVVQREIPALLTSPDDADHVIALSLETVTNGHAVLIFCPTKNWCEKLCETIARRFYTLTHKSQSSSHDNNSSTNSDGILKLQLNRDSLLESVEQLRRCPVGADPMLSKCILNGVAYHHAGLTFDERDIIEGAFRQGHLRVLVATSTLSSGVNLPARRVIIRSPMFNRKVLDTLTYKQMAGRAGRKGVDTEGESVLICKPQEKTTGKLLLKSELPPVMSCLHFDVEEGLSHSLKRAILEVVISGVAPTPGDVITYINCTLLSASLSSDSQSSSSTALMKSCISFLQDNEFVTIQTVTDKDGQEMKKFHPTQLGSAILASSLSPDEGLLVFTELQKARRAFVLDTELHIIYLVTPVYTNEISASIDWYHFQMLWEALTPADRRVAELVGVSESFIVRAIGGHISGKSEAQRKSLAIHRRFYTALVLNSLVQECPLLDVAAKFNCNKGQLQSLQQSASTYAGMLTVFCGRLGWHNLELILSQFQKRLSCGVQQELIDLVRISSLNASSARMLYNAGYHTVADVARADVSEIENLFKTAVPFQSDKKQDGETDWELSERRRARCIWLTGRKGVTELDAAAAIIEEAKVIVQGDLGVSGIAWGSKNSSPNDDSSASDSESSIANDEGCEDIEKEEMAKSDVDNSIAPHSGDCTRGNRTRITVECEVHKNMDGSMEREVPKTASLNECNSVNKGGLVKGSNSKMLSDYQSNSAIPLSSKAPTMAVKKVFHKQVISVGDRSFRSTNISKNGPSTSICVKNPSTQSKPRTASTENKSDSVKISNTSGSQKRHSNGSCNNNKSISLNRSRSKEKSFFGQVVVSPPVSIRIRSRTSLDRSEVSGTGHAEQGHKTQTGDVCGEDRNPTGGMRSISCQRPLDAVQSDPNFAGMDHSEKTETIPLQKECVNTDITNGSLSQKDNVFTSGRKIDSTNEINRLSSHSDFSFSESFVIDTQTVNIINQNDHDKKTVHTQKSQGNEISSKVHSHRESAVSASESILHFASTKTNTNICNILPEVCNKSENDDNIPASSDPFFDSLSEMFDSDCDEVKDNASEVRKSTPVRENPGALPSEPIFDSVQENASLDRGILCQGQKGTSSDKDVIESDSSSLHGVHRLHIENDDIEHNTNHKTSRAKTGMVDDQRRNAQQSPDVFQQVSNIDAERGNEKVEHNDSDEEEVCMSLIAASNYERLMQLDEGMMDEETIEELNSSNADLHINEWGEKINASKASSDNFLGNDSPVKKSSNSGNKKSGTVGKPVFNSVGGMMEAISNEISPTSVDGVLSNIVSANKNSHLDDDTLLAALNMSDSFSFSPMVAQKSTIPETGDINLSLPRNSTPNTSGNVRKAQGRKPGSLVQGVKNLSSLQYKKSTAQKGHQKLQDNGIGASQANALAGDDFFTDSFSSSLMDKVMEECEKLTNTDQRTKETCLQNNHHATNSIIKSGAELEKDVSATISTAGLQNKNVSRSTSNNSSRNDGSDCVPPTPPDESASVASPFKMSFYSPLKPNMSKSSNKCTVARKSVQRCLNGCPADNFTAIRDDEQQQRPQSSSACLSNNNSQPHEPALSRPEKSKCGFPVENSKTICHTSSSTKNSETVINGCPAVDIDHDVYVEENQGSTDVENSQTHQQASQLLTQQSFTIIDVCADKQLFHTFVAEWKTIPYFAMSVAYEKKCLESKQPQSAIGGKFVKKRTSPPKSKPTSATGIPLPDSGAAIVGMAISWENRDSYFISLMPSGYTAETDADDTLAEPPLDEALTLKERFDSLCAVLDSTTAAHVEQTVAMYDIKTSYVNLARTFGISLPGCEDPRVADWLREPSARLKNLHRMVANHSPEEITLLDAVGGVSGYQSMGCDIKSKVGGRLRACTESVLTMKLMHRYHSMLEEEQLLRAFTEVEMPALISLARMELNGFGVSETEIESQKALMTSKIAALEEQAYQMAGHVFSLTSTDDVAKVLYIELKLPINGDTLIVPHLPSRTRGKRTTIGSTSKEILEKLQKFHPLPAVILEWRRLSSALTKSLFALQRAAKDCPRLEMARVYGDCQMFTATGRVSMSEPNLQNIPKDFAIDLPDLTSTTPVLQAGYSASKVGPGRSKQLEKQKKVLKSAEASHAFTTPVSMRKMFVPFQGGLILAADYSQLELRIIAHLSGDAKLASILNTADGDVFIMIAAQMKGLDIEEVSAVQRQQAKQVCYGMLYGIGPKALGEQLEMDENEAGAFMETFKSRYPGVRKYLRETVEFCQKNGYVRTLFNRRRYLPSIKHSNPHARAQAERQAINTTIQGSAADLVKIAMTTIDKRLMELFPSTRKCHSQLIAPEDDTAMAGSLRGAFFVLQLHDELIYEVSADQAQEVASLVKHLMETAVKLSICMPVKVKIGPSWGELQDYVV